MPERLVHTVDTDPGSGRLRFELIFASVWLAVGLLLVPALVFWVGIVVLGPYGEEGQGGGLGSFYATFFGDLATGEVRAWLLTLGPLILVSLVRAIFVGARGRTEEPDRETPSPEPPSSAIKGTDHRRVEPRIGD